METTDTTVTTHCITEGSATVETRGNVFYNPVQEFNRDLSISVLNIFAEQFSIEKQHAKRNGRGRAKECGTDDADGDGGGRKGLVILEALSATGLRSIRYAKEVSGAQRIIANDISKKAVEDIQKNIELNAVGDVVETSHSDATMLMYSHRQKQFDAIDLDPYGCPSIFLDAAVQAVKDGGMLLVTATDMAVLAGNSPETCFSKYGAISLKMKSIHEMALRILLQCISTHANRYGRFIEPVLSVSADFYIRVFVRIFSGAAKCKLTTSKLSTVYHCNGCGSYALQPLGEAKRLDTDRLKFCLPPAPPVGPRCDHCGSRHYMGGPIWSGTLHDKEFVERVATTVPETLKTRKRIQGILSVIAEELDDVPLYYTMEKLASTLRCETPPMLQFRSAILNAGYKVSFTHTNRTSIKTNAPATLIWDIMRRWEKEHPVKRERLVNSPGAVLLGKEPTHTVSFELHPDANPESRKQGLVRFQVNPTSYWGPGTRATAMVGEQRVSKSKRNQGKRKRNNAESEQNETKKIDVDK